MRRRGRVPSDASIVTGWWTRSASAHDQRPSLAAFVRSSRRRTAADNGPISSVNSVHKCPGSTRWYSCRRTLPRLASADQSTFGSLAFRSFGIRRLASERTRGFARRAGAPGDRLRNAIGGDLRYPPRSSRSLRASDAEPPPCASSSEDRDRVALDHREDFGVERATGEHDRGSAQRILAGLLDGGKVKQVEARLRVHVDQQIDVAIGSRLAPRVGADDVARV